MFSVFYSKMVLESAYKIGRKLTIDNGVIITIVYGVGYGRADNRSKGKNEKQTNDGETFRF